MVVGPDVDKCRDSEARRSGAALEAWNEAREVRASGFIDSAGAGLGSSGRMEEEEGSCQCRYTLAACTFAMEGLNARVGWQRDDV